MELATKILGSGFFAIYTDMIRVTNMWKDESTGRKTVNFNSFVKQRLMLLSKFQFKAIRNFNLPLCLRLQYLLQNHLANCLDEKSLQVYSQYLCKENKKLMFSIIQNPKNFEVFMRELQNGNVAYMDFLIELFYSLKHSVDMFVRTQQILSQLGFMDFVMGVIGQMSFTTVGDEIVLEIRNKHFQEKERFLRFLELILFFIYKNRNCFILKVLPITSSISKSQILTFLFTLPFQSTFLKCNVFVMRVLEIMVININELIEEGAVYREFYASALVDVIERYNLFDHKYFYNILEILVDHKEYSILRAVFNRVDLWPHIVRNMQFGARKRLCTLLVKLASCFLCQMAAWPESAEARTLLAHWVAFLKRGKNNMLTASVVELMKEVCRRYADRVEAALAPADWAWVCGTLLSN